MLSINLDSDLVWFFFVLNFVKVELVVRENVESSMKNRKENSN